MNRNQKTQLDALMRSGKRHVFPKKHQIVIDPSKAICYFVHKGFVKRYLITNEGAFGVQALFGSSMIFPLTPVYKAVFDYEIYKGKEIYYYETVTDCEMYSVNEKELLQALESEPELYKDLFFLAGLRLESNIYNLENASLRDAKDRVYSLLVWLGQIYGEERDDVYVLAMPVTHEFIAEMLNLARETVSKRMARLHELRLAYKVEGAMMIAKNS